MRALQPYAVLVLALSIVRPGLGAGSQGPWKPVADALGRPGELAPDGSYKVTVLREDVGVKTASGMPVPKGLGLNSYAAFAGSPDDATAVGDTCMLEQEVNPE